MCSCGNNKGTSKCGSKRSGLRKIKTQLTSEYNTTQSTQLRLFLKGELEMLKLLLKDIIFCPTTEFINNYKKETDATISELK